MKKEPLVIGIVGTAGSGKSLAAEYITKKYKGEEFSFSSILAGALKNFRTTIKRKDLIWLMNTMRKRFGDDILTKTMGVEIRESANKPLVVVSGIRLPSDYEFIRSFKNNKVLFITASQKTRWQRVTKRGEKADDKASFKEFQKLCKEKTERHIEEIGRKANYTISNEGSIKEFQNSIDHIMEEILGK